MPSARRPRIRFAQNFLTDPRLIDRLIDASSLTASDLVYEIGPGTGIITERLVHRCRQVIAIEQDPQLVRLLRRRFADRPAVEVRCGDAVTAPLPPAPLKVFASIPFNQTAAIVTRLTQAPAPPEDQYLVVQREAAERFTGRPAGTLVAALLHPWFRPSIEHRFRRADFDPAPGVDVVLLRLAKRGPPLVSTAQAQRYRDFVTAVFTAWQPSVCAALARLVGQRKAAAWARAAGIGMAPRPSELGGEQWLRLFAVLEQAGGVEAYAATRGAEARLRREQAVLQKRHRTRAAPSVLRGGLVGRATRRPPPRHPRRPGQDKRIELHRIDIT